MMDTRHNVVALGGQISIVPRNWNWFIFLNYNHEDRRITGITCVDIGWGSNETT